MYSQIENIVIAISELVMMSLYFNSGIPTALSRFDKTRAFETWCIAIMLGMFGFGRFMQFINNVDSYWMFAVGHIFVLVFTFSYYRRLTNLGIFPWHDLNQPPTKIKRNPK